MPTLEQDLAAIFSDPTFSVCAEFTLNGGSKVCVDGIFRRGTIATNVLTQEVETTNPSFDCQASSVTSVNRGNRVTVDGDGYTVERIEKIGNGVASLFLKTE